MENRAEVSLRGLGRADIPAWCGLLAAIEAVEQSGDHYNEADLFEEMDNPDITLGEDIVGAFLDDRMVGYFLVYARSGAGEVHKVAMDGGVHPDLRGRGIGSVLAPAMLARARAAHAATHPEVPARYGSRGLTGNAAQTRLVADLGMHAERWSFLMRADLAQVAEQGPLPDGYAVRSWGDVPSDVLLEAHNAAFADHPHFTPWNEVMWKQMVTESRSFRPGLSYVATHESAPDAAAAYIQTNEYDAYFEATGRREAYVAKVGTLRAHRGRGLATGLLRRALADYRAAGFDEASLDVDSENPTGALGVYRRAGFQVERRWIDYALVED